MQSPVSEQIGSGGADTTSRHPRKDTLGLVYQRRLRCFERGGDSQRRASPLLPSTRPGRSRLLGWLRLDGQRSKRTIDKLDSLGVVSGAILSLTNMGVGGGTRLTVDRTAFEMLMGL